MLKDGTQTATAAVGFAQGITTPTGKGLTAGGSQALIGYFAKRAAADQSITTNTTLASATNMSFSIAANEEWVADFYLVGGDNLLTTGIKLALTVPSGATMLLSVGWILTGVVATGSDYKKTTTSGTALDFQTTDLPVNSGIGIGTVWVLNSSTAGTVQLQIAQSSSSATALILQKGSHMIANRIA